MPLSIYRRPGSKIYHVRGTVNKERIRFSTRTVDKDTALRIAAQEETRAWKRSLDGPGAVLTFGEAFSRYQAAGRGTPRNYVLKVLDYWKDTYIKDITPGAVMHAAAEVYPNASGATRNRQFIVVTQAVINYAAKAELCQRISVERFQVETKVKKPASWSWVQTFMLNSSPHLGALCCFMFLTGARISEALSLMWPDVDLGRQSALIRSTKIGSERLAHLPPSLIVAIANVPWREGRVFKYTHRHTVDKSWRNACKRAGIEMLSPHCCRHGFATSLLQSGVDVVTVAKLGGWKTPALVLKVYGHAMDDPTLTDRLVRVQDAGSMMAGGAERLGRVMDLGSANLSPRSSTNFAQSSFASPKVVDGRKG